MTQDTENEAAINTPAPAKPKIVLKAGTLDEIVDSQTRIANLTMNGEVPRPSAATAMNALREAKGCKQLKFQAAKFASQAKSRYAEAMWESVAKDLGITALPARRKRPRWKNLSKSRPL